MPSRRVIASCLTLLASATPAAAKTTPVQFWWPDHLDLAPLRAPFTQASPLGETFDYAKAFSGLDFGAVKNDLRAVMTQSQPWWPADYGNYGPFFIRMAWHSAGTYRVSDGRGGGEGGQQRFEPLNSWPDNGNLDKARRLLWPIKQKYGERISWADLIILASNVALENMGLRTYGFAGGRGDDWQPDLVYWGPEKSWLGDHRYGKGRQLSQPLAAAQMGLIYVNPEGPNGQPDPMGSARDIRQIFGRMAMNDEETVALIAGGHTFGKAHGAHRAGQCLGPPPAAAGEEEQNLGWRNRCGQGHGPDTITSGLEGAWTEAPTKWSGGYLDNLFAYDWVRTKSPGGATQWIPKGQAAAGTVPDAHDAKKRHAPIMLTTDLALKVDPAYRAIALDYQKHPDRFEAAFARAWFKLTHRDMGPRSRYLGPEVPKEPELWQDPVPAVDHPLIDARDVRALKARVLAGTQDSGELVRLAWSSAASFRGTDKRGGANGARIRLEPQRSWAANNPGEAAQVLARLEAIAERFNREQRGGKRVSVADLVVMAGDAAVEQAAQRSGRKIELPFFPGRTDATLEGTSLESFAALEPRADGFRNFYLPGQPEPPATMLVERASLLTLSVQEMAVLVGGLRVLGANTDRSANGVLTAHPGALSNDFFVNLLDMSIAWRADGKDPNLFEGLARDSGKVLWRATTVDLVFGANSELRAVAEVYAQRDGQDRLIDDFAKAWSKVMHLDRFDLLRRGT